MKRIVLVAAMLLVARESLARDKPRRAGATPATINVSGTWNTNFAGSMDLLLHQKGSLVWGRDNVGYLVRGDWADGRLTLFYRMDFKPGGGDTCSAPAVAVVRSKGTATRMEGVEFLANGQIQQRILSRASPNPGADFSYPYGAELTTCGSLPAHDLVFETGSDVLAGTDWPMLAAVAEVMKKDPGLKIEVVGHTDSTGDPAKNKDLSQRRADSVKKVLAQKYGADAARISTKGWGAEQPLATNDTVEGRGVNRRVEILVVR